MCNFFKIYKKSLSVIVFLTCFFTFTHAADKAEITEFKTSKAQVGVGESWVISGSSKNATGCLVQASDGYGSGIYRPNQFSLSKLSDGDVETITYTLTCYSEIISTNCSARGCTYSTTTAANPRIGDYEFPSGLDVERRFTFNGPSETKTIVVKVIDVESSNPCSTDPASSACILCGEGSINTQDTSQCKTCASAENPESDAACKCASDPSGPVCKASDQEALEAANGLNKTEEKKQECSLFGSWGACIQDAIVWTLDATLLNMAALLLTSAGYLFEIAIYFSVVNMSALVNYSTSGGVPVVTELWTLVRDILNIGLIFVLLWAAIQTIIGNGKDIKKIIAGVILFGVMTNFSLFLTKAAVDVSNVIALEFYQQLRTAPLNKTLFNGGVTATILSQTSINNFFVRQASEGQEEALRKGTDPKGFLSDSILYRVFLIATLVVVSFMFLQAAMMFIARMLTLIAVMVFSPLMFAGGVFTPIKNKAEEWRDKFVSELLFAPVFFICLYLAVFLMSGITKSFDAIATSEGFVSDMIGGFAVAVILNGILILGFTMVLNTSKKFSSDLSGKIGGYGNKMFAFGATKAAGLGLSGSARGMRIGAKYAGLDKLAKRVSTSNSRLGMLANKVGVGKLGDATFDIRNSKLAQGATKGVLGALSSATGGNVPTSFNVGEGSKTTVGTQKTFTEYKEAKEKAKQEEYNKRAQGRITNDFADFDTEEQLVSSNKIKSVDSAGVETSVVRPPLAPGQSQADSDKAWAKVVSQTNAQNKTEAATRKSDYLVAQAATHTATSRAGKAAYAAAQTASGQVRGVQEDIQKLEDYNTEIDKYGPGGAEGVALGMDEITIANPVAGRDKKGVKDHWNAIEVSAVTRAQKIANILRAGSNNGIALSAADRAAFLQQQTKLNKLVTRAKGAEAKVDELDKKLNG